MKYLITGATGFLGRYLVKEILTAPENEVIILSRSSKESKQKALSYSKWDGTHIPSNQGPVDVVINLAGAGIADKPWSKAYKKVLQQSRINTSTACVKFIQGQKVKPKVFLAGSAIGYYGGDRIGQVDDSSEPGDDFLAETCSIWEEASKGSGIRTVHLRTGVIFGSGDGPLPEMTRPFKFFMGGPIADGQQYLPWMHVVDWVNAVRFLEKQETIEGPVLLTSPKPVRNEEFAKSVATILKRPGFFRVPKFALNLLMGEQAIVAWGSLKTNPKCLVDAGFKFQFPDLNAALKDLLG